MKSYKGLLLGAVAASVLATGALVTPAQADGSAVVGHKKGNFYVKSKDGNYSVLPGFKFQFDSTAVNRDDEFTERADSHLFDIARLFVGVKGRAGSPNLTYGILFNIDTGANIDAKLNYKIIPQFQLKVGNYKSIGISSGNRTSSSSGWLVDDPANYGDLASGRNVGVSAHGTLGKVLKYELKVSHGGGAGDETSGGEGVMADFGLNWEPFGRYGAHNQPDYSAKNKLRILLGAGYQLGNGVIGQGDFATYAAGTNAGDASLDYWHAIVGAKYAGLHLTGTYEHANFQSSVDNVGEEENGRRSYTWLMAASYMIVPKKIPLAMTYTVHDGDVADSNGGNPDGGTSTTAGLIARSVGVGAAYLFNGHKNKLHASYEHTTTKINADAINGAAGGNDNNEQIDHALKLRWQVLF
jgi:hypothetical protein